MDAAYGGACFTDVSGVSRRNVLRRTFVFPEDGRMVDPEKPFILHPNIWAAAEDVQLNHKCHEHPSLCSETELILLAFAIR